MQAKEAEGITQNTVNNKRAYVRVLMTYLSGIDNEIYPQDLTADHVRGFMRYLQNDYQLYANSQKDDKYKTTGLAPASVNTVIRGLRGMFNWLLAEKYITDNPFLKVRLIKEPKDTVESIEIEEARRLLKEPDQRTFSGFRDYVLYLVMLDTGVRVSEAISLQQQDIDLNTNTLHIRAVKSKTKTGRIVPFSKRTSRALRELIAELKELDTDYVFVTIYGNTVDRGRVRQKMKQYAKAAGIKSNVSPHILRHTFAKYYLLNGGDMMTLQKLLGHSTVDMVRRYVQMTQKDVNMTHSKYSPLRDM